MPNDIRRFLERMAGEARAPIGVPSGLLRRAAWRRARTTAILGIVAALVGYGAFVGAQALTRPSTTLSTGTVPCSWGVVPSPDPQPERLTSQLRTVLAFADDDVWAAGSAYVDQEGGETYPLILHWDGASWSVVPVPDAYRHEEVLALDGASPRDVWGIGLGHEALHWDGIRWSTVPLADPGTRYWHLEAVSVVAPDDVWAVGNTATGSSGGSLVEHWDGSGWNVVEAPSPAPEPLTADSYPSLSAVDALGPTEAWATGQTENVAPVGQSNTVALQWDGTAWTRTPTPDVAAQDGVYGHLLGVAATGPEDAWAVGIAADRPGMFGGGDRALIEHWDGHRWTVIETLPADSRLVQAVALATDEAWAVGSTGFSGTFRPLIVRWDGIRWSEVETNVTGQASLSDITTAPTGDLWAVGTIETDGHGRTLVARCRR